ncbi:alcohol dehydrogenase catalytic domain-containing protein [Planosporangium thailandense]|uniref:Alcohol dehydrogenase catalytic domain-containing protein n=2 Tax=Planosporangium thailandense TaxID=765197 RepID=A0ABX0Y4S3_9ACTN|nr:alcohol dehydrogenase catalytic domain-containing protein [Planosporangium thailandense]
MDAMVATAPWEFRMQDRPAPAGDGGTTLDVRYVGLCGTDLHIVHGEHPRATYPLVLGHEIVGAVPADADSAYAGRHVVVNPLLPCGTCAACRRRRFHVCARLRLIGIDRDGGLAARLTVPDARLHPVPAGLAARDAALAEPLAVAVHAVRRSALRLGDTVVVVGAGPVGLLTALAARHAGAAHVYVAEPVPARRAVASALGFALLDAADPAAGLADLTGGDLADVAFDAAAHPSVAATLTGLVVPGGQVVIVGSYGAPAPVDLQALMFRGLSVVGVRVYRPEDIDAALAMLAAGVIDTDQLVTAVVPLERVGEAFAQLRDGTQVKVLVDCRTSNGGGAA